MNLENLYFTLNNRKRKICAWNPICKWSWCKKRNQM